MTANQIGIAIMVFELVAFVVAMLVFYRRARMRIARMKELAASRTNGGVYGSERGAGHGEHVARSAGRRSKPPEHW